MLLLLFFLSGLAALVYQTAWIRQFALVFGTSHLAIATVLSSYMGGLAVGAALAGRWVGAVRQPLRVYALLELGLAAAALLVVPAGIATAPWALRTLLGGVGSLPGEGGLGAGLFYAACSFLILLGPTALMGATLPLLTAHAVRDERDIGERVGLLYAFNTAGAVAGTVLAGFVLLPTLGLERTIWVGAATNVGVALAVLPLARSAPPREVATASETAVRPWSPILPLIAISGAVSFSYEVLWSRLLGHQLGGSVQGFATMLGSFLCGIALGSAAASRLASSRRRAALGFAWAQLGTAALARLAFAGIDRVPDLAGTLAWGSPGLASDAIVAALVLLPGALAIGATFPFAVRVLARDARDAAPAAARVFAWNTVGAVVGGLGAGFFGVPSLGFAGLLTAAAVVNLLLALGASTLVHAGPWTIRALSAAGLAALVLWRPGPPWTLLRSSPISPTVAPGRAVHYGVGRSATVLLLESGGGWRLSSDGLPESSIQPPGGRAAATAVAHWLGILPTLARPETRSMLVVGLGGGLGLEGVPAAVETIDVAEIEPEVVAANRRIGDQRRVDPLADPRVTLVTNDARNALLLTSRRYDAIVSQPSHPWTAGASHLYTREFFELARDHLTPGGVLVQWMGLAFVDESLLRTLAATLVEVFPYVEAYRPHRGGVLFVASDQPLDLVRSAPVALEQSPELFAELGLFGPADVLATRWFDTESMRALGEGAPLNTDGRNRLLMRGVETRHGTRGRTFALDLVPPELDPVVESTPGVDRAYLVRRMLTLGFRPRAQRAAQATREPATREAALGLVALSAGQRPQAVRHLERALELEPANAEARFALLTLRRTSPTALDELVAGAAGLDAELARALVEGWQRADRSDWPGVAALEPALSQAGPTHPAFPAAARLRIGWRVAENDPGLAGEALALADALGVVTGSLDDLVLRAQAASRAGATLAALDQLDRVASQVRPDPRYRSVAERALAVLAEIPGSERKEERKRVDRRLRVALP